MTILSAQSTKDNNEEKDKNEKKTRKRGSRCEYEITVVNCRAETGDVVKEIIFAVDENNVEIRGGVQLFGHQHTAKSSTYYNYNLIKKKKIREKRKERK